MSRHVDGDADANADANADAERELAELTAALQWLPDGWSGTFWREVGSTQDAARAAAAAGAPSRSIFVADHQTAGRGRRGRVWLAPPGTALLMSILLRELSWNSPGPSWRATTLACVALAEAIEALVPDLRVEIKWPNDLMLDGRKVAGILAEAVSAGHEQTIIVGVGLNVSTEAAALAAAGPSATSLLLASGRRLARAALVQAFVRDFESWMGRPHGVLHAAWESRLWGRNQAIRLADGQTQTQVVVLGVDGDGALRVRLPDGSVQRRLTGELVW